MELEQFVLPIFDVLGSQCGCGFFVGNHFITAGHVVLECNLPLIIFYKRKKLQLNSDNLINLKYEKKVTTDIKCGDIAIFALEDINSPLVLADYIPTYGRKLICISFDTIVLNSDPNSSIFENNEKISMVKTIASVREEQQGNFFACNTESILHKGNSGSPLIDSDNRVVGILHGGTIFPKCCVFQNVISLGNKWSKNN